MMTIKGAARSYIFATAGHIDHGKTSLIKRLTGIDTDRLQEEKKRGITIDLGYADLKGKDSTIHFIDVPGHEKFVKNMLAGAGTVVGVLFVVSADESIKPQTIEHYEICRLLGIKQGVIAITKKDLVDDTRLEQVIQDIRNLVSEGFLHTAPIIPVSVITGEGMEYLKLELFRTVEKAGELPLGEVFRLPVDRSFIIQGFGTVITGSLIQGRIRTGETVESQPSGKRFTVRSIQVFNRKVDEARAGQRTALNLQRASKEDIARGDILTNPHFFTPSKSIEAAVELLFDYQQAIGRDCRVKFYHLSGERLARLTIFGKSKPIQREIFYSNIVFDTPVFTLPGDRFILRRLTPVQTIGGGTVVFNHSAKRDAATIEKQAINLGSDLKEAVLYHISEKGVIGIGISELRALTGMDSAVIRYYLKKLLNDKQVLKTRSEKVFIIEPAFNWLKERVLSVVKYFHTSNPSKSGISRNELIDALDIIPNNELFNELLDGLVQEDILMVREQYYAVPSFFKDKLKIESDLTVKIDNYFKTYGLIPPDVVSISKELSVDEADVRQIINKLIKKRVLVAISSEMVFHSDVISNLIKKIEDFADKKQEITIQEFKNLYGLSRKYAIPLLEYLDRTGVTRRLDDNRRLII